MRSLHSNFSALALISLIALITFFFVRRHSLLFSSKSCRSPNKDPSNHQTIKRQNTFHTPRYTTERHTCSEYLALRASRDMPKQASYHTHCSYLRWAAVWVGRTGRFDHQPDLAANALILRAGHSHRTCVDLFLLTPSITRSIIFELFFLFVSPST